MSDCSSTRWRPFRTLAKLILHRDLKPSNILVTSEGEVKLVDFGIAKLLDDESEDARTPGLTQFAGQAFTPEYAAPEQVQGGEVSSATDVYALGVLLYVLLTGHHPTVGSAHAPLDQMRAIVDTEHTRPSDAGRSRQATGSPRRAAADRARCAATSTTSSSRLSKAPAERYASVEAFAEDLRRYLSHEPVSARPDSLAYRASKFVARNKLAVGAAVIVLLTIIAAAVVSVRQAIEATRERDRALSLAARNEAVIDYVQERLTEVAPADQPIKVADLIERGQQILLDQISIPEHRATILGVLSGYYLSSGKPAQAGAAPRALELTNDAGFDRARSFASAYAASLAGRPDDAQLIEQIELSRADRCRVCSARIAPTAQNMNDRRRRSTTHNRRRPSSDSPIPKPDVEADCSPTSPPRITGRQQRRGRALRRKLAKMTALGRGESSVFSRNNWGLASFLGRHPPRARAVRRSAQDCPQRSTAASHRRTAAEPRHRAVGTARYDKRSLRAALYRLGDSRRQCGCSYRGVAIARTRTCSWAT